jgi:hypothetical protein
MFSHAKCTNIITTEILLTEFNPTLEVRHNTHKIVLLSGGRAQLCSKTLPSCRLKLDITTLEPA